MPTINRSARPSDRNEVITRAPPSTSSDWTPARRSASSAAIGSTPCGPRGTTTTDTPRRGSSSRRSTGDASVVTIVVAASPPRTRAPSGVRRVESSTTRIGEAPGTIRTVSCGSSVRTVPTPTRTASHDARSACETRRSSSPLIHRESPVDVAILPSSVWAYFTTT